MGLDINGTTIDQASGMLTINTGVVTQVSSAGAVSRPNTALFSANGPGVWVYPTASAWSKLAFANVQFNTGGGGYNPSLTRFTAPVDGMYAFQLVLYLLRDSATAGEYMHPVFYTNGGTARNVNPSYHNYRIRCHGFALATYSYGQLATNFSLLAGDYVEPYLYCTTGGCRYYQANSRFTGFLMG